jgi:hypothetical protein
VVAQAKQDGWLPGGLDTTVGCNSTGIVVRSTQHATSSLELVVARLQYLGLCLFPISVPRNTFSNLTNGVGVYKSYPVQGVVGTGFAGTCLDNTCTP